MRYVQRLQPTHQRHSRPRIRRLEADVQQPLASGRLVATVTSTRTMTLKRRVALVRWLLIFALLGCSYCTSRVAMLAYFMQPTADVSIFRPATAEEVGRIAQPYQSNTRETDGMFRIVQKQHVDLDTMFSRLEIAAQLSWTLAVASTVVLGVLSCVFAVCLGLVWNLERQLTQALRGSVQPASGSV